MTTYEITNPNIFTDADVSGLKFYNGSFHGTVSVETSTGWQDFTGEHGASDYEQDYGFKIIQE